MAATKIYEVNLPWKPEFRPQPTGYDMCLVRLHQLRVRLQKDKDLLHEYNSIFESQLQDGIIEKVPNTGAYPGFFVGGFHG